MKKRSRGKKVFLTVCFLLLPVIGFVVWTEIPRKWNPEPREVNGTLLFEPNIENHPFFYSKEKIQQMIKMMDAKKMLTDPHHLAEYPPLLLDMRFLAEATVGKPAPDFELLSTDGKVIRLSDYRGKILAFMFVSCT